MISRAGKFNAPLHKSPAACAVAFGFLNVTAPICGPPWYLVECSVVGGGQYGLDISRPRFRGVPARHRTAYNRARIVIGVSGQSCAACGIKEAALRRRYFLAAYLYRV